MALVNAPNDLRGFLVPIYQTLGATMSATSQAGPRPGGATPTTDTDMVLETSGELDNDMSTITFTALAAGDVGTSTIRWKYAGDDLRNWDPPTYISGWEFIDRTTTASRYIRPHVVRRGPSGRLAACVSYDLNTMQAWRQGATGLWASTTIEDTGNNTTGCLVPLPSGRLLCFYAYQVDTSKTQIRQKYSDDYGATWSTGSTNCLLNGIACPSTQIKRIRAVYLRGQILLVAWRNDGTTDYLYQWASSDTGGTLRWIETVSSADEACPDIAVRNGTAYVATIGYDASLTNGKSNPYVRVTSSASTPLSSLERVITTSDDATNPDWGDYSGTDFDDAECALLADDDGLLWLYAASYSLTKQIGVRVSTDGGATWSANYTGGRSVPGTPIFYTGATTDRIRDLTVAPERGRAVLLHRSEASTATADDSLCAAYLGGWSTVGKPSDDAYDRGIDTSGWEEVYVPIEEPDNFGGTPWTKTTAGAPTATLGGQGLALSVAAAETILYARTVTLTGSIADGIEAEFHVLASTGSWVHELRISDGANDYNVRVTATSTTCTLRDLNAGADIGSALAIDGTKALAIKIALDKASGTWAGNNGRVRAWARQDGPYTGATTNYGPRADREWTPIADGTGLTAGVATTSRVRFGCATGAGTATYRLVAYTHSDYVAGNIAASANGQPRGRVVPSSASPIHIAEGLRIHASRGPAQAGDSWTTSPAYDYPVTALDPSRSPSPRRPWRSTGDGTQHDIILSGLQLGWRSGDPLGVLVLGTNVPAMTLYRDSGGVSKVMDMDFTIPGLGYTRSNGQIIPASGGASSLFHHHERTLAGARVNLGGGVIRKVRTNRGGAWIAGVAPAGYPHTQLDLESFSGGDPASGTLDLWMPNGLFIVESMAATDTLMFRIPVTTTAEDYFEIGQILIGRFRVYQEYSFGRSLQWTPQYALTTAQAGGRTGRRMAPTRKAIEVAWDDAVETIGTHTAGSAPDYYSLGYTSADALAAPSDTPRAMGGLFDEVAGAAVPVGHLSTVQKFSAATTATAPYRNLDPTAWMYGRIVSPTLRVDNVVGDERKEPGEVVRIGVVRVEEEL